MNTPPANDWTLPWPALRALPSIPDLRCGPLSPLGRLAAPAGPADPSALASWIQGADPTSRRAFDAMLDPAATLAFWMRDRDIERTLQLLWPDSGASEGWAVQVGADGLRLRGPVTLAALEIELRDRLALHLLPESTPLRTRLDARQCWALLALLDALGTRAALRLANRENGTPQAIGTEDVASAWLTALAQRTPGWAAGLALAFAPAGAPEDFPAALAPALDALVDAGWLVAGDTPAGPVYAPGLLLAPLADGVAAASPQFALMRSERLDQDHVETLALIGFRLGDAIACFDLSALAQNRADLLLLGASDASDCIAALFATGPAAAKRCPHCGAEVGARARFCGACGQALAAP
jgi:hypothetical protein